MSGETQQQVSGWTTDTLKENLENEIDAIRSQIGESDRRYEQRFDAQEKATTVAITSAKEAVIKAETATEKRFESVNEFRAALGDQASKLLGRGEFSVAQKSLIEKIESLEKRLNLREGATEGADKTLAYIISAISVLFGIIGIGIAISK